MNRRKRPAQARHGLRKRYVAVSVAATPKRAAMGLFTPLSDPDRYLVGAAGRQGTSCPACGWHTNPAGCCRKACAAYSGYPA